MTRKTSFPAPMVELTEVFNFKPPRGYANELLRFTRTHDIEPAAIIDIRDIHEVDIHPWEEKDSPAKAVVGLVNGTYYQTVETKQEILDKKAKALECTL